MKFQKLRPIWKVIIVIIIAIAVVKLFKAVNEFTSLRCPNCGSILREATSSHTQFFCENCEEWQFLNN